VDDSGFPKTPDRLPELFDSHVQHSEVSRTMTGTCGPYNLGSFATRADKNIYPLVWTPDELIITFRLFSPKISRAQSA
jgi:hypothetical protein